MRREETIRLRARYVTVAFGSAIALLGIAHLAMQSVKYHLGLPETYGLVRLFDMGVEANLPTFVSIVQLLLVSFLLGTIGVVKRQTSDRFALHWLFLAVIFLALAADEWSEIHEMTIRPIREMAPSLVTGLFYWAWIIPAALLVTVVSIGYARFVFSYLPWYLRRAALLGAALFVGGAIIVEMPEARYVERHGLDNFTYAIFVLVEETLEMIGVLVFMSGLLNYLARDMAPITVQIEPAGLQRPVGAPPDNGTLGLREGAQE